MPRRPSNEKGGQIQIAGITLEGEEIQALNAILDAGGPSGGQNPNGDKPTVSAYESGVNEKL